MTNEEIEKQVRALNIFRWDVALDIEHKERVVAEFARSLVLQAYEEAAKIAENEKVDFEDTQDPTDESYNHACRDVAYVIRALRDSLQEISSSVPQP